MARPPGFTINIPNKQLRLPTTIQGVTKKTPVQPSFPPPPHLLNARPKATAKASGGGGASSSSSCSAKRGAVGTKGKGAAVKDTSKAAKINLTEYLARNQLKRIRREWHAQFEVVARDILDTWNMCTKLPGYRCQEECPPRVAQLVRQAPGRLIRGSGAYRRGGWRQDVQGHEAPYSP